MVINVRHLLVQFVVLKMCGNCFRIKVCNRFAPNRVAVKCGICKACRKVEQDSWSFRLRCELEDCHSKGWKIGFITLTYDDSNLPLIPSELIDTSKTFSDYFPCFNKFQVKDFIISLRKYLYDHYSIGKNKDGIKYLIVSEFGKHTKRPHYHMVISWPPLLSSEELHKIICSLWSFGFVFPKNYLGGLDSHNHFHLSFEVTSNPYGCSKYIAKYICKDLDFFASLSDFWPVEGADLSNYFPFHIQSKSLGYSRIVNLTDDDKLKLIKDGFSFVGEDKLVPIPLYFKRKILFSPLYVVERQVFQDTRLIHSDFYDSLSDDDLHSLGFDVSYKRLVRRKATDFFKKYYNEVFDKTLQVYTKFFERVFDKKYLVSAGILENTANDFLEFLSYSFLNSPSQLALGYLCYFGLPIDKCFDVEPSYQWFLRYDDNFLPPSDFFRISQDLYDEINTFVPLIVGLQISSKIDYSLSDKIAASVKDFWSSAI